MPKHPEHRRQSPAKAPATRVVAPAIAPERIAAWLERVPAIVAALHSAADRTAALDAIAPITSLPADEQTALATALGQQRGDGAGDALALALALAELGTDRGMAKEARRSSIRLRSAGTRADITIPHAAPTTPPSETTEVPEFVGAWASRTRDRSEVTLALTWTRPFRHEEVDGYILNLNYWEGEIEFIGHPEPLTQRRFERDVLDPLRRDAPLVEVTLGQARALIEEALDMQSWRQRPSTQEWLEVEPMIRRRVLQDEITATEDVDLLLLAPDLADEETLVNFWGAWSFGDFVLAYALLGERHALRERTSQTEFVTLRRRWYDEAHPARFQIGALTPQTQEQSGIWLPGTSSLGASGRQNLSIFWSVELQETPLAGQLPEMPLATLVNPDSSRHWYWQSVTMERDEARRWRVGRIRDDGAAAQGQPVEQLLQRSDDLWREAEAMAAPEPNQTEDSARQHSLKIITLVQESLSAGEAALMRLPLDRGLHERLRDHARQIALWERAAALTQRMLARFQDKVLLLRDLSAFDFQQARFLAEHEDEAGYLRWLEIAVTAARASVAADRTAESLVILAELLVSQGETEEAEALLRESLDLQATVGAWLDLGDLLMQRQQSTEAVEAFERASRLEPTSPQIRWRLARALELVGRPAEARLVYEDALAKDDNDAMAHALLGNLLFEQDDFDNAATHLGRALELGLVSAQLLIQLTNISARAGQFEQARMLLNKVVEIEPSLAEQVKNFLTQIREEETRQRRERH